MKKTQSFKQFPCIRYIAGNIHMTHDWLALISIGFQKTTHRPYNITASQHVALHTTHPIGHNATFIFQARILRAAYTSDIALPNDGTSKLKTIKANSWRCTPAMRSMPTIWLHRSEHEQKKRRRTQKHIQAVRRRMSTKKKRMFVYVQTRPDGYGDMCSQTYLLQLCAVLSRDSIWPHRTNADAAKSPTPTSQRPARNV